MRQQIWDNYKNNGIQNKRRNKYADMNDDDIEKYVDEINQKNQAYQRYDDEIEDKSTLLPTNADPTLWLVRCRQGSEREACISLMNKYLALKKKGTPISILSATISDKVQSIIYVEAYKEANVREAIKGLNLIFQRDVIKVKREESTSVYDIDKALKINITKGQWVKINTGLYVGDFAKVKKVDDAKMGCY